MKTERRYFVAINQYRSSTDEGFANTWRVWECNDRAHQVRILEHGLPCRDSEHIDNDGRRRPTYSTMGVRAATQQEIREAKRENDIRLCEYHIELPEESRN